MRLQDIALFRHVRVFALLLIESAGITPLLGFTANLRRFTVPPNVVIIHSDSLTGFGDPVERGYNWLEYFARGVPSCPRRPLLQIRYSGFMHASIDSGTSTIEIAECPVSSAVNGVPRILPSPKATSVTGPP